MKGQLLLDGGRLGGSWFHRSVVLVCEHNAEGALGLVLTKASDSRADEVLEGDLGEKIGRLALLVGGPVQPAALSFLRAFTVGADLPDTQSLVLPGLALGHRLEDLIELAQGGADGKSVQVFAGYAGWSPGQLDGELKRDSWLIEPATRELVFDVPREEIWRHILRRRVKWDERLLADSPEDASWN